MTTNEKQMELFENLVNMTDEALAELARNQNLSPEGAGKDEIIAMLLDSGYDPEKTVQKLLPTFLGLRTCSIVDAVNASIRASKFTTRKLPQTDRYGRLVMSRFAYWTVPCKQEAVEQLIEEGAIEPPQSAAHIFEAMKEDPSSFTYTFARRRAPSGAWLVTLHAQPKSLNVRRELAATRPTPIGRIEKTA